MKVCYEGKIRGMDGRLCTVGHPSLLLFYERRSNESCGCCVAVKVFSARRVWYLQIRHREVPQFYHMREGIQGWAWQSGTGQEPSDAGEKAWMLCRVK